MLADSLSNSASATGAEPKNLKEWKFGLERLDGRTTMVLRVSPTLPPVRVNGWPENVRQIKPKLMNKAEQLILQDALAKGLVSMINIKTQMSELQSEIGERGNDEDSSQMFGDAGGPSVASSSSAPLRDLAHSLL